MKKTLRKEIIHSKLAKLEDTLAAITQHLPEDYEDFAEERMVRDAVFKEIEFSIQIILDICSILNKDLQLGIPETDGDELKNLYDARVLSKKIIQIIKKMKGFRNILVHRYGEINDEQAYITIKEGLKDFDVVVSAFRKICSGKRNI